MLARAVFLVIVGVVMPLLAIQSDRALRSGMPFPPRRQVWASVIVAQWILLLIAVLTAWRTGLDLLATPKLRWQALAAGAGLLAAAMLLIPISDRLLPAGRLDRLLKLGPRGRRDAIWWIGLSLTAGICEEFVYRGVLFNILRPLGAIPASLLAAAIFGITHMVQGVIGAAAIFIFALGFHWLVWRTGELYTAMAVHAIYDLLAGLYVARILRRRHPELATDEDLCGRPEPPPNPP
jgi:uncharacterized protein